MRAVVQPGVLPPCFHSERTACQRRKHGRVGLPRILLPLRPETKAVLGVAEVIVDDTEQVIYPQLTAFDREASHPQHGVLRLILRRDALLPVPGVRQEHPHVVVAVDIQHRHARAFGVGVIHPRLDEVHVQTLPNDIQILCDDLISERRVRGLNLRIVRGVLHRFVCVGDAPGAGLIDLGVRLRGRVLQPTVGHVLGRSRTSLLVRGDVHGADTGNLHGRRSSRENGRSAHVIVDPFHHRRIINHVPGAFVERELSPENMVARQVLRRPLLAAFELRQLGVRLRAGSGVRQHKGEDELKVRLFAERSIPKQVVMLFPTAPTVDRVADVVGDFVRVHDAGRGVCFRQLARGLRAGGCQRQRSVVRLRLGYRRGGGLEGSPRIQHLARDREVHLQGIFADQLGGEFRDIVVPARVGLLPPADGARPAGGRAQDHRHVRVAERPQEHGAVTTFVACDLPGLSVVLEGQERNRLERFPLDRVLQDTYLLRVILAVLRHAQEVVDAHVDQNLPAHRAGFARPADLVHRLRIKPPFGIRPALDRSAMQRVANTPAQRSRAEFGDGPQLPDGLARVLQLDRREDMPPVQGVVRLASHRLGCVACLPPCGFRREHFRLPTGGAQVETEASQAGADAGANVRQVDSVEGGCRSVVGQLVVFRPASGRSVHGIRQQPAGERRKVRLRHTVITTHQQAAPHLLGNHRLRLA